MLRRPLIAVARSPPLAAEGRVLRSPAGTAPNAMSLPMFDDPLCPRCGTIHNRGPLIREFKKLDPMIFECASWTTTFKCVKCATFITISGSTAEAESG